MSSLMKAHHIYLKAVNQIHTGMHASRLHANAHQITALTCSITAMQFQKRLINYDTLLINIYPHQRIWMLLTLVLSGMSKECMPV